MNQTGNYQLNRWEKSDRILMEDFNRDNQLLDAALAELARKTQALQTEDSALRTDFTAADTALRSGYTAADSSIRTDFTAADTALRNGYTAADTAIRNDFTAADAAIRTGYAAADTALRTDFTAADQLVRLLDVTLAADTTLWKVDVSSIDFSKYAMIQLRPDLQSSARSLFLRYNGRTDLNFVYANSNVNYMNSCYTRAVLAGGFLYFYLHGDYLFTVNRQMSYSGGYVSHLDNGAWGEVDITSLKTLDFSTDTTIAIRSGSRLTMWGLKL